MTSAIAPLPAEALKGRIRDHLVLFAARRSGWMAKDILRAAREQLSNPPAGMAVTVLCDEGIETSAEFDATSSYFEAGFDVAIELAALTLAGSAEDDGDEAVQAVLDRGYSRITDIIAEYYVDLAARVDPRRDAAVALRKRTSESRRE